MRIKVILALFLYQLFPFLILLPNIYQLQHIRSLNEIYETWWIYGKDAHVSPFLYLALYCRVMPLFDDLQYFSAIFAPNYVTFDPWVWHKKRSDNIFQFSTKGF